MIANNMLRIHIINVGHGDSILVELPDDTTGGRRPRFGLVDAGGEDAQVRTKTVDYLRSFVEYRLEGPPSTNVDAADYLFEFICLTHPHADHLHGMMPVTEFHYGEAEVLAIAPSIDMRNRYDTYGVDVNDASIVLRITLGRGVAILTGDAHFDSWGKVCEEFPRTKHLVYPADSHGDPDMRDPNRTDIAFLNQANQLDCQLLKVAHHGSKRGTSYEYVEKLSPRHFAIPCDVDLDYPANWKHKFPHPITRLIIGEEANIFAADSVQIPGVSQLLASTGITAEHGTLVYRITRGGTVTRTTLGDGKHDPVTAADLRNNL
ncbi:MAG: hypothetical protein P8181_05465 [bacterium]